MKLFQHPIILATACGHDGNIKVLKKLVNIAADSSAKIIKFQIALKYSLFKLWTNQKNCKEIFEQSLHW